MTKTDILLRIVKVKTGCWLWTGSKNRGGYGRPTTAKGKHELAHRLSYEAHKERIPIGLNQETKAQ